MDPLLCLTRFASPLAADWQAQHVDRLSATECARLSRIRRQLRREQFIVGHCMLRAALATAGCGAASIEVAEDGAVVLRAALPLHASIAHTGTAVAVVVAGSPVGVDLETEWLRDPRAAAALLGITGGNTHDPVSVTRAWVAAEARIKARLHAAAPVWVSGWDCCQLAVAGIATPPLAGVLDVISGNYNAVALHWEAV